ncbi:MAG: thioredoxin family protein [archaeon]
MSSIKRKILSVGAGLAALAISSLACPPVEDEEIIDESLPILYLFTSPEHCIFCQYLEDNVLSDPDIQDCFETNYNFKTIEIYADEDNDGQLDNYDLLMEYDISSIPKMIVVDTEGNEVYRINGYMVSPSQPSADLYYDRLCTEDFLDEIGETIEQLELLSCPLEKPL